MYLSGLGRFGVDHLDPFPADQPQDLHVVCRLFRPRTGPREMRKCPVPIEEVEAFGDPRLPAIDYF
jgi:hypothetical protein